MCANHIPGIPDIPAGITCFLNCIYKVCDYMTIAFFSFFFIFQGVYNYSTIFEHMNSGGLRCYDKYIVTNVVSAITYTICIPVFEFLIYPIFRKCIPRINKRIGLGMAVMLIGHSLLLVIDVYSHDHKNISGNNSCMFNDISTHVNLSPYYLVPVIVIVTIGELFTLIATYEFICAQSPYSMRGLLIGIFYFIYGVYTGVMAIVLMTFALAFKNHTSNSVLSCGSSYFVAVIGIGVVGLVAYIIVAKWYTKRQRGGQSDINHQSVLESYFEKYIRQRHGSRT